MLYYYGMDEDIIKYVRVQLLNGRVNDAVMRAFLQEMPREEARIICNQCHSEFKILYPPGTPEWEQLAYRADPGDVARDVFSLGTNFYTSHLHEKTMSKDFMEAILKKHKAEILLSGVESNGLFRFDKITATPDRLLKIVGFPEWMIEFKYSSFPEVSIKLDNLYSYASQSRPTVVIVRGGGLGYFVIGPNLQAALRSGNSKWGRREGTKYNKDIMMVDHYKLMMLPGAYMPAGEPMDLIFPFVDIPI